MFPVPRVLLTGVVMKSSPSSLHNTGWSCVDERPRTHLVGIADGRGMFLYDLSPSRLDS